MSEPETQDSVQVPDIEITENISSTSHLSASVERLVEVTRRLTVCNQLESALESQEKSSGSVDCQRNISTSDVPSELPIDELLKPSTPPNSAVSSTSNLASPDSTTRQSPQNSTKKWARLLGINPEDIGDEEEFIVSRKVSSL